MIQREKKEVSSDPMQPKNPAANVFGRSELKKFIIEIINSYEKELSKDINLENNAKLLLQDQKFLADIVHAIKGMQKYNAKIPDANTPVPNPFLKEPQYKDPRFAYSLSTNFLKNLFWGGNAADNKKKYFFVTQFKYNNKLTSIAEELHSDNWVQSDVIKVLFELGILEKNLYYLKEKIDEAFFHNPTFATDPQILWPLDNGNYLAISPIAHNGMLRELWERRYASYDKLFRQFETISVGGSNPVNAGDLSASISGKFKLIKFNFLKLNKIEKKFSLDGLYKRKTAFNYMVFNSFNFRSYLKEIENGEFHYILENKQKLEKNIEILIEKSFENLFDIIDALRFKKSNVLNHTIEKLNNIEQNLYHELSEENIEEFALYCAEKLQNYANKKEDIITTGMTIHLTGLFSEYLKGCLL
ncbi:MAG: hypothetical protein DCC88_11795 [Spirobacillus cienkowskii]|uniref:Uncharacterized protein n=1 Tax=Spirobacillus cienkowskii TaxID=495820 RepID=A0A369KQZ7_9BACT|nr:MAG: hypothetical protein DCC88_11795 [Spirobacillus cienkowskii]